MAVLSWGLDILLYIRWFTSYCPKRIAYILLDISYILGGLHPISYKLVYSNYISQNISGFFECLKVVQTSIYTTFGFKPQTKAFQHAQSQKGLYNLYLQFQRTPITCHKVNTIFSF